MAQRYKERLLQGSGISNRKFESEFGMRMLKKMGWTEGKGLGKSETGITDCVQLKRREDGLGLGQQDRKDFNWNDNWWDNAFNSAIKKLDVKKKAKLEKQKSTSSEEPEKSKQPPCNVVQRKKIKKRKPSCSSSSSSSSSSDSSSSDSE